MVVLRAAGLVLVSCAWIASGCNRESGAQSPERRRPLVVCTTTMITDLARQVCGPEIEVVGIMPPGVDPHTYTPRPQDLILAGRADLILYNGLGLEGRMGDVFRRAGARAVALAEDPRIRTRTSVVKQGAPDPHCWWNARYFAVYAERARDALVRLDPSGGAEIRRRAEAYIQRLYSVDAWVRRAIEQIPPEQRWLITSHDAFYYYGEAYGLRVAAVLGISTDANVRALRIQELARLVVANRVPAIFHETSVTAALNQMVDRVVELARAQGAEVRVADDPLYSDSLGLPDGPAGTYIGALMANTRTIVTALSGHEPPPWNGSEQP